MNEQKLLAWLLSQQTKLDHIIYMAGVEYFKKNKDNLNFTYDVSECQLESYNLINNTDLCYDRPNTAFVYSLWYHARRVNTFITFFAKKLLSTTENHIDIFDLGAGTGAVQWSVGLVLQAMHIEKIRTPSVRIINVDSSPIMLSYNKEFLWKNFCSVYDYCKNIEIEYEVNSWVNTKNTTVLNPWLCASYLFDISDDKEIIKNDFVSLVNAYNPSTILISTSVQPKKKELLSALSTEFKKLNYTVENVISSSLIYKGDLTEVNNFRSQLYQRTKISSIARRASWNDSSFMGIILFRPIQKRIFEESKNAKKISLYNPPLKVRREIKLNDSQIKAAKHSNQPTVIVGPAGCGKSVVITERIKNIVLEHNYDPDLKILVTSFNKELINSLSNWISDLLVEGKMSRTKYIDGSSDFSFQNSTKTNIKTVHFEMLAKKVGDIQYTYYNDLQHRNILQEIINDIKKNNKDIDSTYDNVLTPEFILEEYHRVIYGLECYRQSDYLEIMREGRGNNPTLKKNSPRRKIVLECLAKYYQKLTEHNLQSYISRRRTFLRALESGQIKVKYDYVIVDEFQDCTNADFKIFIKLLNNPDNLIIAGDLAQSVHIGKSSKIFRDISQSKREFHRLVGSYRLPLRVSESLEDISKTIAKIRSNNEGITELSPYKGSPPGARPIIVFAETNEQLALKIKSIFECYKIYDIKHITILEKDPFLNYEIFKNSIPSDTDTILRLKGLEKECVLWSTNAEIEFEKEVYEFVYTILTRTSSILIIALTNDTKPIYKKVINLLRRDRLIFWDYITKEKFNEFCEQTDIEVLEDEE